MKSLAAFQSYSAPLQHHHDLPGVVLHDNFQLRRPSLTPNHQSLHHPFKRRISTTRRRSAVILQKWNADVEQGTSIQSRNDNSTDTKIGMPAQNGSVDLEALNDSSEIVPNGSSKLKNDQAGLIERKPVANNQNTNGSHLTKDDIITTSSKSSSSSSGLSSFILGMPPRAILALNAVAIIWGSQHAIIKLVVDDSDAGCFTFLRFGIGALIASVPLILAKQEQQQTSTDTVGGASTTAARVAELGSGDSLSLSNSNGNTQADTSISIASNNGKATTTVDSQNAMTVWRWGGEMGFWMFLGFAFQAIGLATTTAQRSGFLLYLNVKFVPFFAFVLLGRQISLSTWLSALTAFAGTALLAYDGTSWSLNPGDLWSIAAAAASAMYILRLDVASKAVGDNNSVQLNAACLWVVTLLSGIWSLVGTTPQDPSQFLDQLAEIVVHHPWEVFYLSAITTALANFIQTKSQKEVSAERASVIYAMDPVYGALFSNVILGETLTSLGFVGAGMITVAAATNALLDLRADAPSPLSATTTNGDKSQ